MKTSARVQTAVTVASWVLVVPFAAWVIVRLFGLERGFPLVQVIAYTPYAMVLALLALIAVALLRRWAAVAVAALAVVGLAVAVLPRTIGSPDQPVAGGQEVNLIAFNLLRGRADLPRLLEVARDRQADLLSLQEVTPEAAATMREGDFRRAFPYAIVRVDPLTGGGALLSRFPLEYLGLPDTWAKQPRAVVRAPGATAFELMTVHPNAPAGPKTTSRWESDFDQFPPAGDGGVPRVLAGDFNATLDHRNMRDLIGTGYHDAGDATGTGLTPTWPSSLKWPLPVTIDHILVEPPIAITGHDVIGIRGSDHRAVLAELSVPAG